MEKSSFKISRLRARAVLVPFRILPTTASARIEEAAMVLIDLETSQGLIGRSYLFTYSKAMLRPTVSCIEEVNDLIINHPVAPLEVNKHLKQKFKLHNNGGILGQVLSGIDMACWDVFAQSLNQPLASILGSKPKTIRAYNSCGLFIQSPKSAGREATKLVAEGGFKAIKARLGRTNLKEDLETIKNIRDNIDENVELMVDFNQSLNVNEAIKRCRLIDNEGLYWIEDPIRHDNYEGCSKIAAEIGTPLQIGENMINSYEMQKAIDLMAAEYYMPDVQRIGGVTGWLEASSLGYVNDIDLSSHLFPEISCHLLSATANCHWLEYVDWASPIMENPIEVKDGFVVTPNVPGTGVKWNETAVTKYLVQST